MAWDCEDCHSTFRIVTYRKYYQIVKGLPWWKFLSWIAAWLWLRKELKKIKK